MGRSNPIPKALRIKFYEYMLPWKGHLFEVLEQRAREFMALHKIRFGTADRAARQFLWIEAQTDNPAREFLFADMQKARKEREDKRAAEQAEQAERRMRSTFGPAAVAPAEATYTADQIMEACFAAEIREGAMEDLIEHLRIKYGE